MTSFYWWSIEWSRKNGTKDLNSTNTWQNRGGFHMEGRHLDYQANGMDDLRRQFQQFSKHLACYERS